LQELQDEEKRKEEQELRKKQKKQEKKDKKRQEKLDRDSEKQRREQVKLEEDERHRRDIETQKRASKEQSKAAKSRIVDGSTSVLQHALNESVLNAKVAAGITAARTTLNAMDTPINRPTAMNDFQTMVEADPSQDMVSLDSVSFDRASNSEASSSRSVCLSSRSTESQNPSGSRIITVDRQSPALFAQVESAPVTTFNDISTTTRLFDALICGNPAYRQTAPIHGIHPVIYQDAPTSNGSIIQPAPPPGFINSKPRATILQDPAIVAAGPLTIARSDVATAGSPVDISLSFFDPSSRIPPMPEIGAVIDFNRLNGPVDVGLLAQTRIALANSDPIVPTRQTKQYSMGSMIAPIGSRSAISASNGIGHLAAPTLFSASASLFASSGSLRSMNVDTPMASMASSQEPSYLPARPPPPPMGMPMPPGFDPIRPMTHALYPLSAPEMHSQSSLYPK
jgi:actin-related protein